MSMSKKYEKLEIKKDQLLPERSFIGFCNYDEASSHTTSRLDINQQFLRAAEKDGFIKPLLKIKESIKQNDGTEKLEMVNYYSPFQIYIITELAQNSVLDDGFLWGAHAQESLDYYKEHNFRAISWGRGLEINVEAYKKKKAPKDFNPFVICDYYHRFLKLIHTFELNSPHLAERDKLRIFTNTPSFDYNLEPIKKEGIKPLKKYQLDIPKLNQLRQAIGRLATEIDPLEHWYYYIKRHPQMRKELLKGEAALAQRLYEIYDLLTGIVEMITGEKSKPLFDFLYPDITPYLIQKVDYQNGEDIKALQFAIQQFKEWNKNKKNKPFVSNEVMKKLNAVEEKIKDYEQRYGDKSYAGSVRTIETEEKIKLEDLDEETKKDVESTLKQMKEQKMQVELGQEIAQAIEHRLWELKRELQQIFWNISKQFRDRENEWWEKQRNFSNYFWMANREKLAKLPREEQLKLSRKELDKITKEAKKWSERGKAFADSVSQYADLVFCKACRKNPVQLHMENNNLNMWEVSRAVICDECMKTKELEKLESGEWKCLCGKILYKFVHNNTIALQTRNEVDIKLQLEYGKSELEATCPKCGRKNQRVIDWGWMP